jgi:prefoldin subunit 5
MKGALDKTIEEVRNEIEQRRQRASSLDATIEEVRKDIDGRKSIAIASIDSPLDEIDRMLRQLRQEIERIDRERERQ